LLCFRILAQQDAIPQAKVDQLISGKPFMGSVTQSENMKFLPEFNFLMLKGLENI